jgi:hypothetical protein
MITTTTKQHPGPVPGGARPVAAGASGRVLTTWRPWTSARHRTAPAPDAALARVALGACTFGVLGEATTKVTANDVTNGYMGLAAIERPTRHLATRST